MKMIRPVSDLRNHFADISKTIHFESEIYFKLQAAEREAELTEQRYSSKEVLQAMREVVERAAAG